MPWKLALVCRLIDSVFLVAIEAHGEDKNYVAFLVLSHLLFASGLLYCVCANLTDTMARRDAFFKWVNLGAALKVRLENIMNQN